MKIAILDGDLVNPGDISWAPVEALGEVTVYDHSKPEELVVRAQGADAVISNRVLLTREVLRQLPGLKYIGLLATGYNTIHMPTAREQGMIVSNVPGYSTACVAQHTLALLLALTNKVGWYDGAVKAGDWGPAALVPVLELGGKTFGAIGFGAIGKAAAKLAKAFGMRVITAGSRPTEEGRAIADAYVELDELFRQADVISLHCPLNEATRGMIDAAAIEKMKPGVLIVDSARGALIDEVALAEGLQSGRVGGAALDATVVEPLPESSPLFTAPNCLITPHVAWTGRETRQRLVQQVADNLAAFQQGAPINRVDDK